MNSHYRFYYPWCGLVGVVGTNFDYSTYIAIVPVQRLAHRRIVIEFCLLGYMVGVGLLVQRMPK